MNQSKAKKTYIILRLSALGDVAMTLPYIYHAARNNPEDCFVMVTQPYMAQLLIDAPHNLAILPFIKEEHNRWHRILHFACNTHKKYPQATIIDLHQVIRTRILNLAWKILGHNIISLRKPRKNRRRLLAKRLEATVAPAQYVPLMTELYNQTLKRASIIYPDQVPTIIQSTKNKEEVKIGLAPHAQHRGKMISREQTIQLISLIRKKIPRSTIILYGAPGKETNQNLEIVQYFDSKQIFTTRAKDLSEEVREIAQLTLMISMDSANQHIAAMVGTPVVSLWGATHPAAGFIPFHGEESDCLGTNLNCRPCSIYGNKDCKRGDWACIERLDLDAVAQVIEQKIAIITEK